MQTWHRGRLTQAQSANIDRWLPGVGLHADLSWGLVDTVVFDVISERGRFVIKAAGPNNHHIGREITAHQGFTRPLVETGHAAQLEYHDRTCNLLVTRYVEGSLVMGSAAEFDPEIHRQAGHLARIFHDQAGRTDPEWEAAAVTKSLSWLANPHRIDPALVARLRSILTAYRPHPVTVVPTHGDWQPRNWLHHAGTVKAIDFGRFDWRPAASDLCRLAAGPWRDHPHLQEAFLDGYGRDPRAEQQWHIMTLHEAIATAVWAYQVHDEQFERQGHRMIADALHHYGY
ncbi:MAG: phosphotransferase [Gordonia sp. (in: high G+C Gram-positive bacteria)]